MDYSKAFAISAAGMAAERTRVETATVNLANANTVSAPGAAGFTPQRVVVRPVGLGAGADFASHLAQAMVPEALVMPAASAPRLVHEPGHPLADAAGMVAQPAVDTVHEMVTIMSAMRAYEANVAAANAARTLALKTLEIGSGA